MLAKVAKLLAQEKNVKLIKVIKSNLIQTPFLGSINFNEYNSDLF